MILAIRIFYALACTFYEEYNVILDNRVPSLECETNEILQTQKTYIPALISILQHIRNQETATEHLDKLYLLCKKHGYKNTKGQEVFKLREWKKLVKKRLTLDCILREQGNGNLSILKKELDRLNHHNYFDNECLKNLTNSYIYRSQNGRGVYLMYPTSGMQISLFKYNINIANASFYKANKRSIVYSTLIAELPFQRIRENNWLLHNSNPIKKLNEHVDIYQSDPRVYNEKYYDNLQYIFYNPARLLYASVDSEMIYDSEFGYDANKLRKRFFSRGAHSSNSLESTLISEILTWTPEYVKQHPRYIKKNESSYFLQLETPCKSSFLILEYNEGSLQRIIYSNDIDKL